MNTSQSDPRPALASALATAQAVVNQVRPDDLTKSTPCSDFDVSALLGHLDGVLLRLTALARGENPMAVSMLTEVTDPKAFASQFAADADAVAQAWSTDSILDAPMTLPWKEGTGREVLATYIPEITVHTWDLAQAIGVTPEWDDSVVAQSLAVSQALLPPGDRETMTLPNGMAIPFASAVVVEPDGTVLDQLIGWYGRDPRWSAA